MCNAVRGVGRLWVCGLGMLAAVGAAGGQGESVNQLLARLKHNDPSQRLFAVRRLTATKDPAVVEPLIKTLQDTAPQVREEAARSLGELGDKRAVEPLIGALKHKSIPMRCAAADGLGALGDARAIPALVGLLGDAEQAQEAAVRALGKIGAPGVEPLIAALKAKDATTPFRAAEALGAIGDKRAVEPLLATLKKADRRTRWAAATALGKLGDARAVKPLIDTLRTRPPGASSYIPIRFDPRVTAAGALGKLGDKQAVPALKAASRDRNRQLAKAAAEALKAIEAKP